MTETPIEQVIAYGILSEGAMRINIKQNSKKFFVSGLTHQEEFIRTKETEDGLAIFRPKKK